MKNLLQSIAVASTILMMATTAALAEPHAYKIRVDGLSCPFCAYGIEKQFTQIKGVENVETDIATGTVTVTMADGATLDKATAAKAVKDAGFGLGGFVEARQ